MAIVFGKPYQVIRRVAGGYVEGLWVPAAEAAAVSIPLNVQPVDPATPGWDQEDLVAFGEVGSLTPRNDYLRQPGDIVLVGGERYLVLSRNRWDVLPAGGTTHDAYRLQREIPKGPGEV